MEIKTNTDEELTLEVKQDRTKKRIESILLSAKKNLELTVDSLESLVYENRFGLTKEEVLAVFPEGTSDELLALKEGVLQLTSIIVEI